MVAEEILRSQAGHASCRSVSDTCSPPLPSSSWLDQVAEVCGQTQRVDGKLYFRERSSFVGTVFVNWILTATVPTDAGIIPGGGRAVFLLHGI